MLLRSSSAPFLSSLLPYSKESSPESEPILQPPRTISVSCPSHLVETDHLHNPSSPKKTNLLLRTNGLKNQQGIKIKGRNEGRDLQQKAYMIAKFSIQGLFPCSDEYGVGKKDCRLQTSVMGGGMGSKGGCICGGSNGSGGGSDGGHGSGWDFSEDNNHGRDKTDAYYQNMIEANPSDALLLGNYAVFLKEVRGDYPKAKEYLERAILANPGDGHILSLYADLIWQTEKNADRAEGYFVRAIKSAPDDCYVLASYAKFLWEAEEDEEDKDCRKKSKHSHTYSPDLFQETNHRPHLTAAS